MLQKKCYMCDSEATSVEHVPPRNVFPEFKDAKENYRVNLITVPSCDLHNGQKSQDDEFLMVSIAGIIGNNSIGYEHYNGKIQRAIKRSSYKLLEKAFLRRHLFRIEGENKFLDILWGTPDYKRLISCFTHIAYGIYRHHFETNFQGTLKPYLGFLHTTDENPKTFKEFIKHRAAIDLEGKVKHGENQGVFYYQFTDPDKFGIFLLHLCFYENVNIYVSCQPIDVEKPFDLGMELLNSGVHTIIRVGDKEYEFNKISES
ncbi:hypothetical protein [Pseudomonas chlororaphis]|uniref:hypothetical protein n=1 Tax=Pseudomonas chlororaphis TaxID=587753 RepID=UPI001389FBFC|nr:hypothetical protein [Pseudomonas chlororaphis]